MAFTSGKISRDAIEVQFLEPSNFVFVCKIN